MVTMNINNTNGKECYCECHKCHLLECTDCITQHHAKNTTYSNSYVVDMISEYFHRYNLPEKKLGYYYYIKIFEAITFSKVIQFELKKLRYLDYLFEDRNDKLCNNLFHLGIIKYMHRNGKGDYVDGLNRDGHVKWVIQ